jgi:outer membrane receptor protein involved in Fe transport
VDGFSATIDWYKIEIDDMIAVEPGSAVYEACLSPASNPTASLTHPACTRIIRNPATGGATASNVSYINAGDAMLSGVDFAADWRVDMADMGFDRIPGTFGINFLVSTLLDLKTQATRTSPVVDWKGTLGPDPGTSLNNGAFDYRLFTTVSYGFNDWDFSLRWRHLPEAGAAQEATSAGPVVNLGAEDSYNVFDLSASWAFNDSALLRVGVDNLLDEDPVITGGRNALDPNPTTGQGTTEAGFYDILGRRFFVGIEASF